LKAVLLLMLTTLFGLLLVEALVRFLLPQTLTVPWADQLNGVLAPRPNVRGREFVPDTYDVTISFSSQRFRGQQEYSTKPGAGVIRLAVLGDSVTFGNGANDNQTYPFELQSILKERLARTSRLGILEVINAGIGGTGTAEQALWYEHWVKQFHPQLVVLNVFCNDVDGDLGSGLFTVGANGEASPTSTDLLMPSAQRFRLLQNLIGHSPGYAWLAQHSQAFNLLRIAVGAVIDRSRRATLSSLGSSIDTRSDELFRQHGLALMAGEVMWLEQRVSGEGARLAVTFVPCRESVYPSQVPWAAAVAWKSPAMVERLQELSSRENIPFADLTPPVRERARRINEPLYYNGRLDTHPTPTGYRVIAELVAQFLFEKELIRVPTEH
jgi:lysophospholipase L1-like esterase